MGSKFDYEEKFDRAQQRSQRRNDEIVRKFRHKPQNVFRLGQMFKVDLNGFYHKSKYGTFNCWWTPTGPQTVIALSDSDNYTTHLERDIAMGFEYCVAPYHMWPFMWEHEIIWYVVQAIPDPMTHLRGSFNNNFKRVK